MNLELLKNISVEINGRTFDPALEKQLEVYAIGLQPVLDGLREVSKEFPLALEPAPVYSPE
ncbi:hypothetical protein ACTQ5K_19905 [Niallia sp. Sow4_A1]|uniref:hypothetical protein n=1 Tax=Bacillaceae TaxID=186817 RepID=UPI0004E0C652|nr:MULTISPECIES: hypothetical protein [Bacillaceae]MCM3364476.1 hypothetical protein [Niallia sp. MER TA 168]CAI9394711.1 hypothetical protein BACSP_03855 [Bacillus sp. T2.9-1]